MPLSNELFSKLEDYIDRKHMAKDNIRLYKEEAPYLLEAQEIRSPRYIKETKQLKKLIETEEETFSEMLFRLIDKKNIKNTDFYKDANIDKELFLGIRDDKDYKPSKSMVISFALALQLDLEETKNLLLRAGYAFSPSNKFDLVVEFFIKEGFYNIDEINRALDKYGESLLNT